MSYEIVKKIRIENDKVYVTSASNNVRPRTYSEWHNTYFDKVNKKDIEILHAYEEGIFQAGSQNKYTRALKILRNMPEYQKFDWHKNGEDYKIAIYNRDNNRAEFDKLCEKALATKLPKQKYILQRYDGLYARRVNKYSLSLTTDITKAKKFDFENEAITTASGFTSTYKVLEVK